MKRTKRSRDFLDRLTGPPKRRPFVTVDIESKDGDTQDKGFTRPFLIGTYDPVRGTYREFRDEPHLRARRWEDRPSSPGGCIDKVMTYLLSSAFKGYNIYAHNGGSFDHLHWLQWLRMHSEEFGFEVVPVQSSIQAIKVWRIPEDPEDDITERWTFLDSMKLFPTSLNKMLQTFGLGGKVEHDLDMQEDDPRWSVYLRQDCVGLAEALLKIHELVEKLGGEVGMTAPSTAMKLFRRRFLGHKGSVKKIPRHRHWPDCPDAGRPEEEGGPLACTGCFHKWIRLGYYGGRTELFRTYGRKLHYYDINSSYAAALCELMPVGDRIIHEGRIDWRMTKKYAGFVECTVYIPEDCQLPPLPHKAKNGKLMFPTGRFSGVWTTRELALLEDPLVGGKILEVKRCVWMRLKPVFKGFVEELWRLRDKTQKDYDHGLSEMAKRLLNSLYGKFGMREERTSIVFRNYTDDEHCFLCGEPSPAGLCAECEGSKPAGDVRAEVWYQRKKVEAAYIIPHISAYVTSLARERIWRFMKQALEAGGDIYYTDTDSILTDALLPSSSELGALKDEYPGQELEGWFLQPKVYMIQGMKEGKEWSKVTMKGFPQKLRTKENLELLKKGEVLSYPNLEKIRTLASHGFSRGPMMRDVKKSFKSPYDKRIINPDGITTRPVVLDEGFEELDYAAES